MRPSTSASIWDHTSRLDLPSLAESMEADVCVVGLGGSGLSAVRELLSLGRSVVAIDAREIGGGAAGRNGGFLLAGTAPFYHDAVARFGRDRARTIYLTTLAEIDRTDHESPAIVRRAGSLRIASSKTEAEDCQRQLDAMIADGLPVEPYEGAEGEGLLMPADAVFDPLARCRALAERCLRDGARLFIHTTAVSLSGTDVVTPNGRIHCRSVVVAVDGGLERLFPELTGRIRTARLQMLATSPTTEVSLPRPVYARWGFDYWQQLPDGRLALGGARDLFEASEWTTEAEPTVQVQTALERLLREGLGVTAAVTHRWAAAVGFSSTGLPYLGQVRPGVWAAGGYSGTGNLIGTLCGRAAARLAVGSKADFAEPFL